MLWGEWIHSSDILKNNNKLDIMAGVDTFVGSLDKNKFETILGGKEEVTGEGIDFGRRRGSNCGVKFWWNEIRRK